MNPDPGSGSWQAAPAGNIVTPAQIEITEAEIDAALAPWTIRKHAVGALSWQAIRARKTLNFRLKRVARGLASAVLPSIRPTEKHRDPEYVNEH